MFNFLLILLISVLFHPCNFKFTTPQQELIIELVKDFNIDNLIIISEELNPNISFMKKLSKNNILTKIFINNRSKRNDE